MEERGVTEAAVEDAIRTGEELPARHGRKKFRKNFPYDKEWGGQTYRTKQVVPVIAEEGGAIIVVTVYSYYF